MTFCVKLILRIVLKFDVFVQRMDFILTYNVRIIINHANYNLYI